jgi:hypothetical protein
MKLEMMQNKKTVIANAGMHPYAFTNACKLTEKLGGKACNENARFKATFKTVKVAEQFVTEWNAQYEQALANKGAKDEPKKGKGKKPTTSRKPKSAKGDSKTIDFNAFKGTKSEKNRALHAELVSRGLKDSRTDEYQAIWQARPWAKA